MLFLIFVTLILVLFIVLYRRNSNYWKRRNVIQENDILWKFFLGKKSIPEHFKDIYDKYDGPIGTFTGSKPTLILKDLEDVQAVLSGEFQSFYRRGIVTNPNDTLADNVLFMEDYKRWKCIRQKLTPVFTTAKLKNMYYIMDRCARDFVDMIDSGNISDKSFDVIYKYTTASIAASVFGIDTNIKSTMDSPLSEVARKSIEPTLKNNITFTFGSIFPSLFLYLNMKFFGEHEEFFVGVVKEVMENRRRESVKRHDFIDICVELQNQGTMHDPTTGYELEPTYGLLAAQAFFFFIAGADTTATTMHFTLLELASNPDALKKLHEEIDNVFKNGQKELSYSDIEKLQYLDMVISEAMRKYPTIGSLQRECTKDVVLPASKLLIEKGELVVVPVYGIQRDEKHFPNPDKFDPERFGPDRVGELKKFSFLPFGEGNRVCIGSRFARLQLKAGLAWLLRSYTLEERLYQPKHLEKSSFSLRDTTTKIKWLKRNI